MNVLGIYALYTLSLLLSLSYSQEYSLVYNTSKEYSDISCLGEGLFTTIESCHIQCLTPSCDNAKHVCSYLDDCDGIKLPLLLSNASTVDNYIDLSNKLVQLVSFTEKNDSMKIKKSQESCYKYGEIQYNNVSFRNSVFQHNSLRKKALDKYLTHHSAALFLHFRKNSGTTMCNLAKLNNFTIPQRNKAKGFKISSSMGMNCNPDTGDMQAWWGSKEEQLDWIRKNKIQYYGHEVHLPNPSEIPFGDVVMFTVMRHPILRIYSTFLETHTVRMTNNFTHSFLIKDTTSKKYEDSTHANNRKLSNKHAPQHVNLDRTKRKHVNLPSSPHSSLTDHDVTPTSILLHLSHHINDSRSDQDILYFTSMVDLNFKNHNWPDRSVFHINEKKLLTEIDLDISKDILNKFSFISILESGYWMTPYYLKNIFHWKVVDVDKYRAGSHHSRDVVNGFEVLSNNINIIQSIVSKNTLSLELYQHGVKLSCLHYYSLINNISDSYY